MIALAAFSAPASADYIIAGDADDDCRITTTDVALALHIAAGDITPDQERTDMNADGTISSLDALMIRMMTQVSVDAPEIVSGAFDAKIEICDVTDLDSGQFDLTFDPAVVNVTNVSSGEIDGTMIPIDSWNFTDAGTIRVLLNLPAVTGISGDGQIATISFETTGTAGDISVLELSRGSLVDCGSNETPALWFGCEVVIGVPVTVNAPEVITEAFTATVDVEDISNMNSGQFDLSFDPGVVNVTNVSSGEIGGTEVPVALWRFIDADTIRVIFKLSGVNGTSGSGSVATIEFAVPGSQSDTCTLDITDGILVDTAADEIPATWADSEVAIGVPVAVNAPEVIIEAFTATVDVEDISNMNSGQFDLTFDPGVVNVTNVSSGEISGTAIPIVDWRFMDTDTIRVIFKLSGVNGTSGSGSVATIDFARVGSQSDACALDITDGTLVDTAADAIPATWADSEVAIGVSVTVNAPEVIIEAFTATIDVEDILNINSGQFDLTFDPGVVNVTNVSSGEISGTEIPIVDWRFMDVDTIRVIFKLSGVDGVGGSGSVATIDFARVGSQSDACALDIAGTLVDTVADAIPATWADANVAIGVPVTVSAPETVSDTFAATVDVEDISNINSGQFDLTFDSGVVNVTNVSSGDVSGTEIPIVDWRFMDADTIRVLFKLSGADGVSGSGSVATIEFAVSGSQGDTSVLDISDGALSDTGAGGIPAVWIDGGVTV
jgi:hypothetical protein